SAGTISIAALSTTGTVSFNVVNDNLDENDETVILTMGSPTNATLGAVTAQTVTLTDNDPAPTVNFSAASQSGGESDGSVTVTATISAVSALDISVPYTVSGTAQNPS